MKDKWEKVTVRYSGVFQLLYLVLLAGLVYYFWNHIALYPFKLLVVFFHETSHALAAVLTGGSVQELVIVPQQGGYVVSQGGNRFIILNSGYLGSLLWGLVIYSLAVRNKGSKLLMLLLGIMIGLITLFFTSNFFAIMFGLILTTLMILSGKYLPAGFNNFILRLIGLISMAYVPLDIFSDTIYRSHLKSDARMLADEFGGATLIWGGFWLILSLIIIFYSLYRSLIHRKNKIESLSKV